MQDVINDFTDRKTEIDEFFDLLDDILNKGAQLKVDNSNKLFKTRLRATLKSTALLLLYNLVESTISNCLNAIHLSFCSESLKFNELNQNIQKIWLNHHFDLLSNNDKMSKENITVKLLDIVNTLSFDSYIDFTYEELSKNKLGSQFSGNLDSKEIRKIATKYGVVFNEKCEEVRRVRDYRNKLAHGELSFYECSNNMTPQELTQLKRRVVDFIEKFINASKEYIDNKKFKKIHS